MGKSCKPSLSITSINNTDSAGAGHSGDVMSTPLLPRSVFDVDSEIEQVHMTTHSSGAVEINKPVAESGELSGGGSSSATTANLLDALVDEAKVVDKDDEWDSFGLLIHQVCVKCIYLFTNVMITVTK